MGLYECVVVWMWIMIICGELLLGLQIQEIRLLKQFGVLWMLLCEVMKVLVVEGLIELCFNCSLCILGIVIEGIFELFEVFVGIEWFVVEFVVECVIECDFVCLWMLQIWMEEYYWNGKFDDYFVFNGEIYNVIVCMVCNMLLCEVYEILILCVEWVCYLVLGVDWCWSNFVNEYVEILVVLEVCDSEVVGCLFGVYVCQIGVVLFQIFVFKQMVV